MTSSPTLGDAFDNYCFAKIMRIRNDYLSTLLAVHLMQFFVVVYIIRSFFFYVIEKNLSSLKKNLPLMVLLLAVALKKYEFVWCVLPLAIGCWQKI